MNIKAKFSFCDRKWYLKMRYKSEWFVIPCSSLKNLAAISSEQYLNYRQTFKNTALYLDMKEKSRNVYILETRCGFWSFSFLIFEQHHQSKNQLERAARAERRERDAPELGLLFVYLGRRESVIKVCGPTFFWVSFLVLFLLEMKHCASSQLHSLCRWCHIWDKSKTNPNQKKLPLAA